MTYHRVSLSDVTNFVKIGKTYKRMDGRTDNETATLLGRGIESTFVSRLTTKEFGFQPTRKKDEFTSGATFSKLLRKILGRFLVFGRDNICRITNQA